MLSIMPATIAHAHSGRGLVFDPINRPTPSPRSSTRNGRSANKIHQIEKGQQIFTITGLIATTALQAYNVAKAAIPTHESDDPCAKDASCAASRLQLRTCSCYKGP